MKKPISVLCLLAAISFQAEAGWFGPSSFEECILDKLKGVSSDVAARMIAMSCRKQFPDKDAPKYLPIPEPKAPAPAAPAPSSMR